MYDIFLMDDVIKLMKWKSIVFLGDSNIRALYKDFLCLLQDSQFTPPSVIRSKMESTVFGDRLVYHGRRTNGRCYREEREAFIGDTSVSFYFLTKVYDQYVQNILERITRRSKPDVIIINSCVWDITRWGCHGVYNYKENMRTLMKEFNRLLPDCLIIWVTTPPMSAEVRGGFLVTELEFLKYSMRFHVVEANHFARKIVAENGFDVLDIHFHLQMQIHRRRPDGIHWESEAVRYMTNLILRHISLSWDVPLPHRYESSVEDENLYVSEDVKDSRVIRLGKKRNTDDLEQVHDQELDYGKLRSAVTVVNKKEDTEQKKRNVIQLYRVPKREESIYRHMAKAEAKARRKRIRKWRYTPQGDSPQSYAPVSRHNSRASSKKNQNHTRESSLSNKFQPNNQSVNPNIPLTPLYNSQKNPLINSVPLIAQLPLPSYTPNYFHPGSVHSSHQNQHANVATQRHVIHDQTGFAPSSSASNKSRTSSRPRSSFLNRQFLQCNRIFETVNNSAKPFQFQSSASGLIPQPRFNFVNGQAPQAYFF